MRNPPISARICAGTSGSGTVPLCSARVALKSARTARPYYVTAVLKKDVFLFGGTTVKGAVILNAITGDTEYYDVDDIPNWVDIVYDGDLLTQLYDWYGELSGGFFSSVFAKKTASMSGGFRLENVRRRRLGLHRRHQRRLRPIRISALC